MKHLIVGATCYGIAIWLAIAVVHFEPFSLTTFMLLVVGYDRLKEGARIVKEKGPQQIATGIIEYNLRSKKNSRY